VDQWAPPQEAAKWRAAAKAARALTAQITTPQEIVMGESLAMRAFAMLGRPVENEALTRYVTLVGRLVAVQSERPSLPYWFAVVKNNDPIALSLPGGYVFVTTGLLKSLRTESELACVLGHEIAHVAEKHGLETTLRDSRMAALANLGGELNKNVAGYSQLIDGLYDTLVHKGYDQEYEIKADLAGTRYAYMAGYNPEGLLPFLEESARRNGALQFEFFQTHPSPTERIRQIRALLGSLGNYANAPTLKDRYGREALAKL
jgi:predicted Zn-dependent protease